MSTSNPDVPAPAPERDRKTVASAAASSLQVTMHRSFEELAALQPQWDELVESVGASIFLTYDWCRVWWRHYGRGRDLRLFVFRSNGALVGLVPLFLERVWIGPVWLDVAKLVSSDFTLAQFSLPIDAPWLREVIRALFGALQTARWDVLYLGPLSGLYEGFDELKSRCEELLRPSCVVVAREQGVQTCFALQEDWESYLAGLRKEERGDIKRNYKYLAKALRGDATVISAVHADAQSLEGVYAEFIALHQAHWRKLHKAGHFQDWPAAEDFHLDLAKAQAARGRLRLLKVTADEHCLGYEYGYKIGRTLVQFMNARSEADDLEHISVGKIVFNELVKSAVAERVAWVDSMRGKYEYKLKLGGELFPLRGLYVIRRGPLRWVRTRIFQRLSAFLDLAYFRLWYCRVVPKLALRVGPLWKTWIRTNHVAG
jgi:CelD/BcsL family acetyltransferase involved in cellulose biosynthesis